MTQLVCSFTPHRAYQAFPSLGLTYGASCARGASRSAPSLETTPRLKRATRAPRRGERWQALAARPGLEVRSAERKLQLPACLAQALPRLGKSALPGLRLSAYSSQHAVRGGGGGGGHGVPYRISDGKPQSRGRRSGGPLRSAGKEVASRRGRYGKPPPPPFPFLRRRHREVHGSGGWG